MPDGRRWLGRGVGVGAALVALACGGTPEPPATGEVTSEPRAPGANGGAVAGAEGGAIPAGPAGGAWIGLAARAEGGAEPWTPAVNGALVVWHDVEAFRALTPGTAAEVTSLDGPVPVRFREVVAVPLCGASVEVAVFDGPTLAEGPVWLAPRLGRARMDPAGLTAQAEDRAEWKVGKVQVTAEADGGGGRTVVRIEGQETWSHAWSGPFATAAWVPRIAVRGGGSQSVLFSWGEADGTHLQAVQVGPGDPVELGPPLVLPGCTLPGAGGPAAPADAPAPAETPPP